MSDTKLPDQITQAPLGPGESREQPKTEVWIIEDDKSVRSIFAITLKDFSPHHIYRQFGKSEDAINELKQRISEGKPFPVGFFVDGNLFDDSDDFREGVFVVKKIRELQEGHKSPFIVAISGEEKINNKMIEEGADSMLKKPFSLKEIESVVKNMDKNNDA